MVNLTLETKLHETGFYFLSNFFPEPGAPPVPVRGHNSSSTSISVTWGEVPADKQHGDIIHYTVIYEKKEGGTEKRKTVTTRTAELKDLEKYTEYSIKVLAATIKGDGPPSDPIIVRTDQDSKYSYSPHFTSFILLSVNSSNIILFYLFTIRLLFPL